MQEEILVTMSKQLEEIINLLNMFGERLQKNSHGRIGRPTKDYIVARYRKYKPNATKMQCVRDTKLSIKTVSKYWKLSAEEKEE